jgi:hypothetical protein
MQKLGAGNEYFQQLSRLVVGAQFPALKTGAISRTAELDAHRDCATPFPLKARISEYFDHPASNSAWQCA